MHHARGLELIESMLPIGGGERNYFNSQDSVIRYDNNLAYHAAKDSNGVWIQYKDLDLQNKLHYYIIDTIYSIWNNPTVKELKILPKAQEILTFSPDSSDLIKGVMVLHGKSPYEYTNVESGLTLHDTIETRATLTFKTFEDESISIEEEVSELENRPAIRIFEDFKVNLIIEAKTSKEGYFSSYSQWQPAVVLFDSLSVDSTIVAAHDSIYNSYSSSFFYDVSKPEIDKVGVTIIDSKAIKIHWDTTSINTDSIVIEYKKGKASEFELLDKISGKLNYYLHTDLDQNTFYSYRVKAINSNGESVYSDEIVETTGHYFPNLEGTTSGYTRVQSRINESGGVTATVPITIPTGTAGIQPELSISVGHNNGEPSIGGLSAITRVARTYAQDDIIDGVHFDWITDRYALDGERLIAVKGSYGTASSEYRTEQETFQKIVSNGSSNSGPNSFVVKTKDGLTKYYGYTEDSKIELGGDETKVIYWLLNKVEDVMGNYYTITYTEDPENGNYHPQRIDYTGNKEGGLSPYCSVEFQYEQRPDSVTKYLLGEKYQHTKRLESISALYRGNVVRKYHLHYTQLGINQISYLQSITEYGSDGSSFAPTTFQWNDTTTVGFSQPEILLPISDGIIPYSVSGVHEQFTDFNNDGKSDYIFVPQGRTDLWLALSDGKGFGTPTKVLSTGCAQGRNPYSGSGIREKFADFNGDNYIDYAWIPDGLNSLWVALSDGTSFQAPKEWLSIGCAGGRHPYSDGGRHEYFLDYDGDGLSDYLWIPPGDDKWWIAKSNGAGFEEPSILIDKSVAAGNHLYSSEGKYQSFIDVNSDGYLDFLYVPNGKTELWAICATPSGEFQNRGIWLDNGSAGGSNPYSTYGKYQTYSDVNADGLPDKIWTPHGRSDIWVALSNGNGFEAPSIWLTPQKAGVNCNSYDGRYQSFQDINKDGFADYLYYPYKAAGIYVAYSTGKSFTKPQLLLQDPSNGVRVFSTDGARESYADINGDGTLDKIWVPHSISALYVSYLSSPNRLLQSVTNGHGLMTKYEYRPLTDTTIYKRGTDAEYPFLDFQAPMYVATKQTSDDGIGGSYSVAYKYEDAKLQTRGRGFRGFGKIETIDLETKMRSVVHFERDFRHVGVKVKKTEEFAPDSTLIAKTENTIAFRDYQNNVHWSFIESVEKTEYELDGSVIKTINSHYDYDDFGNPTLIEIDYGNGCSDITENSYTNTVDNWHLGRLTSATLKCNVSDQPTVVRSSNFEYDKGTGLVKKEILDQGTKFEIEKKFEHDKFGNVVETLTGGAGENQRVLKTVFDSEGRFIVEKSNALGHTESFEYESFFGSPISTTGPNGLTTRYSYDGFGRKIRETQPDGTSKRTVYRTCNGTIPNAVHYVYHEKSGLPPTKEYYDVLDRKIRTTNIGFAGNEIYTDIVYNHLGNVEKESDPYSEDAPQWTMYVHDALNRPIAVTTPGDRTSKFIYKGLVTESFNAKNQKTIHTENTIGKLIQVEDDAGSKLNYTYDALGNVVLIVDNGGNQYKAEFDIQGNKTKIVDPDMGTFEYTYNTFGELTSQTYPEGITIELKYDKLSRLIERSEPEGVTHWSYDDNWIGKLYKVEGPNEYSKTLTYDDYGRVTTETTTIGKESFVMSNNYDEFGRIKKTTYPSGFATLNMYNDYGYQTEVRRESDNYLYWKANSYNARGQCVEQTYGNNLVTTKVYNEKTGLVEEIKATSIQGALQHLRLSYDKLGNTISRGDEVQHLKEDFSYDNLNRLISSQVDGLNAVAIQYDAGGNITMKSDVGAYIYGENGAGPHAVTSINGDECPSFSVEGISYYSFQKVKELSKDSVSVHYSYGPDRLRYRSQVFKDEVLSQTKTYIGCLYERIEENDSIKEQHYIQTPEGAVAIETKVNRGEAEVNYLHKDHLGSLQVISNTFGQIKELLSFDPWGKPRNATTWEALDLSPESLFARGFTMHEYIGLFSLVNMNGRIYDPVIARFISADPFIDGSTNLQGYNRYSYVYNNPLSLIDPSGYGFFSKVWKSITKPIKKIGKEIGRFWDKYKVQIVSIGVGILTGGLGAIAGAALAGGGTVLGISAAALGGAIGSGFGFGFGSAAAGTLMMGGSIGDALKAGFKNGLISGAVAGVMNGINMVTPSWGKTFHNPRRFRVFNQIGRMGSRAVVNGVASELRGGDFKNSVFYSLASDGVRWGRDAYVENRVIKHGQTDIREKCNSRWKTSKYGGTTKAEGVIIKDPDLHSNVGIGSSTVKDGLSYETGKFMSFLGKNIPGMNSMSVFHDFLADDLYKNNFPDLMNQISIPPAMAIEYFGLSGPIVASNQINNKYWGYNK